jgi:hypothetical protein
MNWGGASHTIDEMVHFVERETRAGLFFLELCALQ